MCGKTEMQQGFGAVIRNKKTVECIALRGENNIKIDLKLRRIEERELD